MLARGLGNISYFSEDKQRELLALKDKWGYSDPRNTKEYEDCDICANDVFRDSWNESGVQRRSFTAPPAMGGSKIDNINASDQEDLVRQITERVMAALSQSGSVA